MTSGDNDGPAYEVRLALDVEADEIVRVCRRGFAASSDDLLTPATIERQLELYYEPHRVRSEIATAGRTPAWQGWVVAASPAGGVLGAAGGGVTDATIGHVLVLYLQPERRGKGIGTVLLDYVTEQQQAAGATEQWVTVTEGNEEGIPFYRARGFEVRSRGAQTPGHDAPGDARSLRMSRAI